MIVGHWALFADWCVARNVAPHQASWDDVARFLHDCPTGPANTRARARAVLTGRAERGVPLARPEQPHTLARAERHGPGWLDTGDALERCPAWRFPTGVIGRRDAFVVAVLNLTQTTRDQLRTMPPRQVIPAGTPGGQWTVAGQPLAPGTYPERCPACRAWWWLESLAAWENRGRDGVRRTVTTRPQNAGHLCSTSPPSGWEDTPTLTPRVDQRGWVEGPMTPRSLTRIMATRCSTAATVLSADELCWPPSPSAAPTPGQDRATMDGVIDTLDDLDAKIDALLAASADLADAAGVHATRTGLRGRRQT